jgi:hypothetical protein
VSIKVFVDAAKVKLRFQELPPQSLDALEDAAHDLETELLGRAQGLASGAVLQVRTGKYVAAIKGSVRRSKTGVYGKVGSRDPRADLFEFGGKTGPHDIAPRGAKALTLNLGGASTMFAAIVHHPGGDYGRQSLGTGSRGKYSVIFTAFDQMRAEIFSRFYGAVEQAVKAGE